jgi:hypothetical protein
LEGQGFRVGSHLEVPIRALAAQFQKEHPRIEHLTLFQIPSSFLEVEESFYERDLRRVRAVGAELRVKGEVFARVGDAISEKEEVATFLAKYFRDMPGTYADRQTVDSLPRTEKGILALVGVADGDGEDDARVPKDYLTHNLVGHFGDLVDLEFTARMEEEFIEAGSLKAPADDPAKGILKALEPMEPELTELRRAAQRPAHQ